MYVMAEACRKFPRLKNPRIPMMTVPTPRTEYGTQLSGDGSFGSCPVSPPPGFALMP
jgi:hypothetical protein